MRCNPIMSAHSRARQKRSCSRTWIYVRTVANRSCVTRNAGSSTRECAEISQTYDRAIHYCRAVCVSLRRSESCRNRGSGPEVYARSRKNTTRRIVSGDTSEAIEMANFSLIRARLCHQHHRQRAVYVDRHRINERDRWDAVVFDSPIFESPGRVERSVLHSIPGLTRARNRPDR